MWRAGSFPDTFSRGILRAEGTIEFFARRFMFARSKRCFVESDLSDCKAARQASRLSPITSCRKVQKYPERVESFLPELQLAGSRSCHTSWIRVACNLRQCISDYVSILFPAKHSCLLNCFLREPARHQTPNGCNASQRYYAQLSTIASIETMRYISYLSGIIIIGACISRRTSTVSCVSNAYSSPALVSL